MTPLGWFFMLSSLAFVHALLLFCLARVIRGDRERRRDGDGGA
jgi:hypothetical protein